MGGNSIIKDVKGNLVRAEKIPIDKIGRKEFINKFIKVFSKIDELHFKKFNNYIWVNKDNFKSGLQFNGSTSYIFDEKIPDSELLKYKTSAGDLDVIVPKEKEESLLDILNSLKGKEVIKGVEFVGTLREYSGSDGGDTIISIFKANFKDITISAQVDFELLDVDSEGKPSDWAKFSRSSTFEDAKIGVKAVFHKYLIRSIVGASNVRPDIVIATKKSTPDKITLSKSKIHDLPRMLKFSVDKGTSIAYEPMLDNEGKEIIQDGKKVYKEIESKNRNYITVVEDIFKLVFTGKEPTSQEIKDFNSFQGIISLMKKYLNKQQIQDVYKRFIELLWQKGSQEIERDNPELDFEVKVNANDYFVKNLGVRDLKDNYIDDYYKNYGRKRILENFKEFYSEI